MNKEDILLLTDKGLAVFKYYIPFSFNNSSLKIRQA